IPLSARRSIVLATTLVLFSLNCRLADAQTYAVLPLCNLTGDSSLDPSAYGIAATLYDALRYVPGVRLVERLRVNQVLQEKDLGDAGLLKRQVSDGEAKELGVLLASDFLFVGEYQQQPASTLLRVTLRCVAPTDGSIDPSKCAKADADKKELFLLQDRLCRQILERGFSQTVPDLLPHDAEAHKLWNEGWQHFYAREYDRAEICFKQAAERDHNFEAATQSQAFMEWKDPSWRARTYLGAVDQPFEAVFDPMKNAVGKVMRRTGDDVRLAAKQATIFGRTKTTLFSYGTDVEVELKGFGDFTGIRIRAKKRNALVDAFGEAKGLIRDVLKAFDAEIQSVAPAAP
ncbi:MAG: hypothetical protein GW867_28750, partial [Armatimonadetes bacterium]|nr:hypothetical protein [Armatimonadota bacterium]